MHAVSEQCFSICIVVEWVRRLGRVGCASRGEQAVEDLGASSDEGHVD